MAFKLKDHKEQLAAPQDAKGWGEQLAAEVEAMFAVTGLGVPPAPAEPPPSLSAVSDDMDALTANVLLNKAARWLEMLATRIAFAEAKLVLGKGKLKKMERLARFKFGEKLAKAPEAEVVALAGLEEAVTVADAEMTVLRGIHDQLEQVRAAASRTLTRHTATNVKPG